MRLLFIKREGCINEIKCKKIGCSDRECDKRKGATVLEPLGNFVERDKNQRSKK